MSATKRYIEDRCEMIAKATGCSWDEVTDIFNHVKDTVPYDFSYELKFDSEEPIEEGLWGIVELKCKELAYAKREKDVIQTGYIPVEYNHYKELVRKAEAYDKWQVGILEDDGDIIKYIEDVLERI